MNDALLIELVEKYEELYNLKHPDYCYVSKRDTIWEEIGRIMKQDGGSCKRRWHRIRDNYRKALALRKTKSKSASKIKRPPKYNKELRFLIPFLNDEEKRRRSNISGSATEDDNTLSSTRSNNLYLDEPSPSTPLTQSFTPIRSPDICTSPSSDCSTSRDKLSLSNHLSHDDTAADELTQYLSSRQRQENTARTTTCQNDDMDPLTHFFLTMARTVKTFPIHDQIQIKADIFNIVNKAEMKLATNIKYECE